MEENLIRHINTLVEKQTEQINLLTDIRVQNAELKGQIHQIETKLAGRIDVLDEKVSNHSRQLDWNWRLWLFFLGGSGMVFGLWKLL